METVKDFDTAEYIETREDVIAYLDATLAENDTKFLLRAIGKGTPPKAWPSLAGIKFQPGRVVKVLDNVSFQLGI
ncbi:MAG: hypothetical protein LBP60_05215 [Spirochaetaceae bacterium]|jgi:DNA-binding phage protein|nr:hypothetical protein [Spirochaetaceae bacterium]